MMRAAVLLVVLMVAVAGCGNAPADGAPEQVTDYRNDTDGVAVEYPSRWVRSDEPTSAAFTGKVQLLSLSSRAPASAEVGCSPLPWASMKGLRVGEFILTLHAEMAPSDEGAKASRPADLLGLSPSGPADLPGGCAVDGVAVRRADFGEGGWAFAVTLASRDPLGERDVRSLEAMWRSLVLSPAAAPTGGADEGRPYWQVLSTHCGVTGFDFDGRRWVPVEPVEADLTGPFDVGHATLRGEHVLYRSRHSGAEILFRAATPEDPLPPPCE